MDDGPDGWNTPFHPDDRQRAWDAWQRRSPAEATVSVIVGGAAFRAAPDLWRDIDADSRADDVRAAVAAMRETTPLSKRAQRDVS